MTTIKLRRGTAAEWSTANPILAAGEMGIETDTRKFKFGDGTTPWNTLAYASAGGGGGGTGDVTAAGDNYFTGNNTFTGTTKFDNDVNIHGANLEVAGALEATSGNITNLQVPNTLTSSGEINAVSIKSTGIRSDDIQTTTNKKYLTEVDVDNQTIQVVDGKLHANLDNIPEPNLFKTPLVNSIFDIINISDLPIGETIINTSCFPTDNAKPYFGIALDGSSWFVGINPGTSNLFMVGNDKTTYVTLYKTYKVKIILNKISDTEIYAKGILYNLDNTTVLLESGFDNVSSGTTFNIYDYGALNSNWISLAYDNSTLKVNDSGQLYANIQTKQDILSDGNGTKVVDNKVDIYQGSAGIRGLNLYQNNGTITKNNDLSITFDNGACGYIYFPNKGVNNNYEVVLHCAYNGRRGSRGDSDIHGIRVEPDTNFPNGETYQGFSWVDVWSSPFRAIIVNKDSTQDYSATIPTANYIKYTIIGTKIRQYYSTDGVDYTSITYNNNLDYVEISESGAYINLCIANRNFPGDFNDCWTNTTLYSDSYVLDKTTNTYLMKKGTSGEGVAVATSNKYGLVLPDNSTIVSNNGVISAVGGGGLEICDIGMALYVDETKGLRRYLNGQIVDINTNTQAFLNRLQQITTLHPSLLCTEEEWQTAKTMSAFGQVGKFVFNYSGDEVVSVRLPRVVNVQGLFDLQNLGMTVNESLPNIKGYIHRTFSEGEYSGALYRTNQFDINWVGPTAAEVGAKINIDASRSSSTYQDNAPVQQEAIQYPYFIQVATGQETENNIINEIELNNPYSLFDSKYSNHELNNLSWLKSEGQWNAKAVYTDAYDKLLKVYNGTETVEGLSVKLSTETYTDYDFVLNTTDETFRLPLKNHTGDDSIAGLTLYFYVGETVQNANLIDAGRIGEQLATKTDMLQASGAAMPSDRYIDLTLGASGTSYTAPANGYFYINKVAGSDWYYLRMINTISNIDLFVDAYRDTPLTSVIPAKKGEIVYVYYNATGITNYFRFIYAEGDK